MSGKPKPPQASEETIETKAFHDLQQAEAKYRITFENAAEGIFQSTPGEEETKARVAQLTALHKTLLDITTQRDLTKLLPAIVQRAARLLKGTSGGLYLCDAEKQECTCVVSYKTPRDYTGTVLRYGEGAAGKVAASGQPLQIDDYRAWEGHAKAFESEQPFRAVLATPLLWHGGVTGVIDVLREQPFTQADLELLTMFASQAAIAVENARALEAERATRIQAEKDITERKQAEEALYLLSDTQRQIAQQENLADIFRLVGQKIHELIGDGYVAITILDEQEQAMKVIGLYGFGSLPESLVRMLKVNPSKMVFDLKDMTADELRLFRSGNLEKFEKGLYHLSVRKVPERVCEVAEKALKLTGVYTMGFVLHDLHFGGLTILAKRDITPYKNIIETITNQATVAMHRIIADQSLRTSEEQLRLITDNMQDMVIRTDLQGRILYASPSHKTILGYEPEHPVGRSIYDLMHPEDIDRVREFALASLQAQTTGKQEFRYQHADGHYLWLESAGAIIFDENGSPTGAVFSTRDITERKRAEETLHESEERFRALIENATDLILVLNPDGTGRYISPSVERILGIHPDELVGMSSADIIYPDDLAAALGAIAYRVQTPGLADQYSEFRVRHKDGSYRTMEVIGNNLLDNPAVSGIVVNAHDITERKRVEEALRESRARLARLSRSLVEAQEQERRRIARELHDEVGQSLTALTISLDGVSQLALDGVMRGKIAEIQELTKNLIAEVNALSVELRPRVLDDLGLIPGLLSLFSRFSTQTGVEIDFKHTGIERKQVTPEIEISAYRIIQEALTNVIRHAGVKTASVRLQLEGDILYIQVQDEGKGFDLQQALSAEDSMGLLSMVERAEQVGGHLAVEAAPGEGTLIACRLPLGESHVERREHERDENRPGR